MRVIADDNPRATASPASVRLLEAPAPAFKPLRGTRRQSPSFARCENRGAQSFRFAADDNPRATASPDSVRLLEAPAPALKPLRGKRRRSPSFARCDNRGAQSFRFAADDNPRATASPDSVRLLEAPAPAFKPMRGTRRRSPSLARCENRGAQSFRSSANDHPRATATPTSVRSLESPASADKPILIVIPMWKSGRASLRFTANDQPRATASPISVRSLEGPAPAESRCMAPPPIFVVLSTRQSLRTVATRHRRRQPSVGKRASSQARAPHLPRITHTTSATTSRSLA